MHATTDVLFVPGQSLSSRVSTGAASFERPLFLLFLLSLALLNPWVRGDGVGYYAFARALLIEHSLNFDRDYISANTGFREARLEENGQPKDIFRTRTGHLDNHFTVGPAILWTPFLLVAHAGVLAAGALGSHVSADGFSAPYRVAMALATAFWGFLGLLLAFRIARQYVGDLWAFLATVAIWWGSSLPVYMYFNPSWSHAHSAFAVSLFVFYWHRTREQRTLRQWCVLALIAGLMLNVYYANAMLLMIVVVDALRDYAAALRGSAALGAGGAAEALAHAHGDEPSRMRAGTQASIPQLLARHFAFSAITLLCLLPTFVTRYIIYGGPFESGYASVRNWAWRSPYFLAVLFSSEHGLFSWTPLLLLATVGLVLFAWREPRAGQPLLAGAVAFYILIACYPDWAGISSFGNRFFVSLTALFIVGLSVFLERVSMLFSSRRAAIGSASVVLAAFLLWNAEFMFQWGAHLIPPRGPISWSTMIRNQFSAAPRQMKSLLLNYLFHRHELMRQIEERDIDQLKQQSRP